MELMEFLPAVTRNAVGVERDGSARNFPSRCLSEVTCSLSPRCLQSTGLMLILLWRPFIPGGWFTLNIFGKQRIASDGTAVSANNYCVHRMPKQFF